MVKSRWPLCDAFGIKPLAAKLGTWSAAWSALILIKGNQRIPVASNAAAVPALK
jgi:hypothetical protein